MQRFVARARVVTAGFSLGSALLPLVLLGVAFILSPSVAWANGGTVEVADRPIGPYLIAVMTSPSPLQVGVADVSVLIYLPSTKKSIADATVYVDAKLMGQQGAPSRFPATHANATNKYFYAANVSLPAPGRYDMTVQVTGPKGGGAVSFSVQVAPVPFAFAPVPLAFGLVIAIGFVGWYIFQSVRRRTA